MANTIKLKRGSGSNPSASDLSVGEVALRTDGNPKLFTKNDAGNVLEVGLVESGSIVAGTIVNADINASAAIAGTKISPDFGSQAITTTANVNCKDITLSDASPSVNLFENDGNPDYQLLLNGGVFAVRDVTNSANRIVVNTDGHVDVTGNLDVGDGIDVTGNITSTGTLTVEGQTVINHNNLIVSGTSPNLFLTDTNNDSDYKLTNNEGQFIIFDVTNTATRLAVNADGHVDILGNLDVGAGVDVTGNITVTGTVDGVDIATRDTLFGGLTSSSGVLTNGVTATTQSASDNSTKVATTAYTDTAISNLVDSSPSTLNTLNELAAALGDDANFSTTVTNSIATKLPLAGGTLIGNLAITREQPIISFNDSTSNPDYYIGNIDGAFRIRDTSNSATRFQVNTDGSVDIDGNLDVGGVLKTTGNVLTVEGATPRLNLIDTNNNSDFEIGNTNGVLNIADSTNSVNRLRILSNGTVIVTGNLDAEGGVDVTGQTDLNIASNGALTEPLMIRNGGTGAGTDVGMVFFNGNGTSSGAGALAKIKAIDVGSFDADLVFETALKSGFSTGGTVERFRIKSDGNIGIGTDSPGDNKVLVQLTNSNSNDFEVVGGSSQGRTNINLKAGNATSGSITSFRLINSSGTSIGSFHMDNSTDDINIFNGSQGGKIFFHTNESGSSLVKMTITDTGRVGINTASPSEKLEVNGTVKATAFSGDGSALTGVVASGSNANTLDNLDSTQFLRSDAADTASGDITFSGGAGAVTVAAASDIRIAGGTWTGEYTGGIKIQPDASNAYIQYHGTLFFRDEGSTNNFQLTQSGGLTITGSVTANGGFSGSGANLTNVNATTLDSIDSTSFLRLDADNAVTSYQNRTRWPSSSTIVTASGNQASLEVYQSSASADAFMAFHVAGDFACYLGLDGGTNKLSVGGWSMGANSYAIYHEGNNPTFSQLGITASNINALGINATTLDNIDSGSFLRSDANDTTTGNLSIVKTEPVLTLKDTNTTDSQHPTINFDTNNNQGVALYHSEFDSGLPQAGYGLVLTGSSSNAQFPNTGVCQLVVLGAIYTGSSSMGSVEKVDAFPSGTRMIFQQTSAPTGWTKDTTDTNQRALRVVSGSVGSGGNTDFTSAFASRGVSGTIGNTTQGGTIADGGNNTNNASISTNNKTSYSTNNATQGGSIANGGNNTNNGGNNTNSSSISISVNNHTLSTAQMPSHTHRGRAANHDTNSASSQGYPAGNQHNRHRTTDRANNQQMAAAAHDNTGSTNSHNHGLSQNSHSHSINTHSHSINAHSHGFTGSAHSHSMPNHNHSIDDHNHSIDDHNHSFTGSAHNHSFSGTSINMAVRYLDVIIAQKD